MKPLLKPSHQPKEQMRATITHIVQNLSPFDNEEKRDRTDVLEWIASGQEIFHLEKPATPPKHLVSYGTVIDPQNRLILLGEHNKSQLKLPPGGHLDLNEHPADAAQRELVEETGLSLPFFCADPLFLSVTETVNLPINHIDVSFWYVFKGDANQVFDYDKEEFSGFTWHPIDKAFDDRVDPSFHRFCYKLRQYLEICPNDRNHNPYG